MTHTLILLATFLTGCGEKTSAATAAAAEKGPPITMPLPSGTAGFVNTLIGSTTSDFSPTDSDGATFAYTRLQFRGDGSWAAEGYVEAMDEKMDCAESGTWTVEEASSKTVGTIAWIVNDTSCVGRDQGAQIRAEVTVGTGGIESAMFR
jgi:hypothetical protein